MEKTTSDGQHVNIPHDALRLFIGWLGVSLPLALWLFSAFVLRNSISDYYYTNVRDLFEGALFFLAVFLFFYRPYGDEGIADYWITNAAAAFSLILALFPTDNGVDHPLSLVLFFIPLDWSGFIHNLGSGGLFLCFAYLSLFIFTKGSGKGDRKELRNWIYRICGTGIVVCIALVAWIGLSALLQGRQLQDSIFWPEAAALVLFGISWLVKGSQFPFLNDTN